jgi:hypothetical protein
MSGTHATSSTSTTRDALGLLEVTTATRERIVSVTGGNSRALDHSIQAAFLLSVSDCTANFELHVALTEQMDTYRHCSE